MMGSEVFKKADSILDIRQTVREPGKVSQRIRRIRDRLNDEQVTDYRSRIILRACNDLLEEASREAAGRFVLSDHVVEEISRVVEEHLPRYLFYRYRYEMFPREHVLDDFPPCLQIEPSSICNYRCVFCYQTDREFTRSGSGHMGFMRVDLFKHVVDQAAGQCEAVTLASRGEPLLCPDIAEMLAYMRGKFLASKINTNAFALDERKCHAILEAGVSIVVFSADAADEPLYSKFRVNGRLDRVTANVARFQEIRARHYPESQTITRVSGVRYSKEQDLDEMERYWGQLVDQVAFVGYNNWENTYEKAVNDICEPCSDLWRRMFVWFDGSVNPCDVDYRSVLACGNAREKSLSDIWMSEQYSRLRQSHLTSRRKTLFPCNRCSVV